MRLTLWNDFPSIFSRFYCCCCGCCHRRRHAFIHVKSDANLKLKHFILLSNESETELFAVNPWTSHYWFFFYSENHLLCRHLDVSSFTQASYSIFFRRHNDIIIETAAWICGLKQMWLSERGEENTHKNGMSVEAIGSATKWLTRFWNSFPWKFVRYLFYLAAVCQIRTVQSKPHTNRAIGIEAIATNFNWMIEQLVLYSEAMISNCMITISVSPRNRWA